MSATAKFGAGVDTAMAVGFLVHEARNVLRHR
jgi:hypothetical protein